MKERDVLICLLSMQTINNRTIEKIHNKFHSLRAFWILKDSEIYECNFLNEKQKMEVVKKRKSNIYEELIRRTEKEGIKIITDSDDNYPKLLKSIPDNPKVIYLKGNLNYQDNISISIVGSRKPTHYGIWATEKFTRELSNLGITIVSGMALGIDTVAHRVSLENNNRTIAVLGTGIDIVYPAKNKNLYDDIIENGGVISEFPIGTKGMPYNFPKRNRIVSGLSLGTVVIEAQKKSGTLITAGHGLDQGREVFAVPGNINSLNSEGTNDLIKQGAKLTGSVEDIIEEIIDLKTIVMKKHGTELSSDELSVYKLIELKPKTLEEISFILNINLEKARGILITLNLKKKIKKINGNFFAII